MAKAQLLNDPTPPPPPEVVLTLTLAEAQALADVFGLVGGEPRTSRRGLIDNISCALYTVRISSQVTAKDLHGSNYIYFQETSNG